MQEADGHGDCEMRPLQQPLLSQPTAAAHGAAPLPKRPPPPHGAVPGLTLVSLAPPYPFIYLHQL